MEQETYLFYSAILPTRPSKTIALVVTQLHVLIYSFTPEFSIGIFDEKISNTCGRSSGSWYPEIDIPIMRYGILDQSSYADKG